jgi:hypothetical protein
MTLYHYKLRTSERYKKITTWKSKALHGRHAYDLDTPDIDKIASNASLKA